MRKLAGIVERFRRDEDGAAMVEYSILIGIITASVIAVIVVVGTWVGIQWGDLCTALAADGSVTCPP